MEKTTRNVIRLSVLDEDDGAISFVRWCLPGFQAAAIGLNKTEIFFREFGGGGFRPSGCYGERL